ncbi:MAG TPA: tetratricopeptide repeat protein [Pyrinomonadaceae bacterium]|nr:tetratricopeptide repeat protein [Pyrinomonadaceae bacterium]
MPRNFFYIFITLGFLALPACAPRGEAESEKSRETAAATTTVAAPVADLIRQADELYRRREDLAKLRESIAVLKRARSADTENFETNWRLARANYFLGRHSTDEKEGDKAFADGINFARLAARLNPNKPEGHFWLGACLGGEAEKSPFTKGLTAMGEIREAMRKVIEIQPEYEGASAYDALAQLELKGGFAGGKAEKALEYLEKGLAIDKANPYANLHLAEAFLALDRRAEAKKQIDVLLKMKPNPDYQPEYEDAVRQAKKLLETKF